MTNNAPLFAIVQKQIDQLDALTDVLVAENNAIKAIDLSALQVAINQKMELFALLEGSAQTLNHIIDGLGYSGDADGISDWLIPNQPKIAPLWSELRTRLANVQQQNEINGQMITGMQSFYNDLFAAASESPSKSSSYDPSGDKTTKQFNRDLGTA